MNDPVILAAENTLLLYARYLREIPSPNVPRHWVEQLVKTLEEVLDVHAELAVAFEPPTEYIDPSTDDDWPPEDMDPDETLDEG